MVIPFDSAQFEREIDAKVSRVVAQDANIDNFYESLLAEGVKPTGHAYSHQTVGVDGYTIKGRLSVPVYERGILLQTTWVLFVEFGERGEYVSHEVYASTYGP